ncbi:hypothetical protein E8E12_002216 [Didymella heteroderae]|uniref:Uncharacterized protein n=1 Tax=Didymella heteroderae TaxID=1769908 RepID=A0A9P4WHD4_9PLEO|nr:hypothetical protein E8E12_002216 [Didymella heteroderae]
MPRLPPLHRYLKAQADEGKRGILADDPSVHYLLGFEKDNVESRPVKTYVRRLWLAFQSSKHSSMPRCFLDPEAERFSKEVEAWVSDFVEDEDRLASEIAKDPLVVDEKTKETRSAFLEDTARTLLVTRKWGDHLWGSRTFCKNPLVNAKREPGDDEPPKWPRDREFIIQTVRYWLAARLQDKIRNPKPAKKIPRVECPEDPDQERASLAAVFPDRTLYDSEVEAADPVTREAVDVTEEATQSQRHEERALCRRSTRRRKPSARAIDIGGLQSTCTDTIVANLRLVSRNGQRQ